MVDVRGRSPAARASICASSVRGSRPLGERPGRWQNGKSRRLGTTALVCSPQAKAGTRFVCASSNQYATSAARDGSEIDGGPHWGDVRRRNAPVRGLRRWRSGRHQHATGIVVDGIAVTVEFFDPDGLSEGRYTYREWPVSENGAPAAGGLPAGAVGTLDVNMAREVAGCEIVGAVYTVDPKPEVVASD